MLKTKATVEQIGKEVVDFLSRYIRVDKLILFGSYSFGNARKDSDFDMAIISEDLEGMSVLKKMELFCKASLVIDSRIELKGFGKNEFLNPDKGSMLEMIKKMGKVIYSVS
jgi:predicted nucleotidyltransferase